MAEHAHADGSSMFASAATLAREAGGSERNVRRMLHAFVRAGHATPTGIPRKRSQIDYQLNLTPDTVTGADGAATPDNSSLNPCHGDTPTPDTVTTPPCHGVRGSPDTVSPEVKKKPEKEPTTPKDNTQPARTRASELSHWSEDNTLTEEERQHRLEAEVDQQTLEDHEREIGGEGVGDPERLGGRDLRDRLLASQAYVLCNELAEKIARRDPRLAPEPDETWHAAARKLLEKRLSKDELETLATYSQAHPFWRSRITGMPKLAQHIRGIKDAYDTDEDPWQVIDDYHANYGRDSEPAVVA
jgi:hypothetical protein